MTHEANAADGYTTQSIVRHLPTIARVLMALLFLVVGLNGFLNFLPQPSTPMPEGATALSGGLLKAGYMFPLIFGTQVIGGALLLSNRFVPLALVLLAPIIVNIVAFHVFLAPSGIVPALVVAALEVYLAWTCREAYRPMLAMRVVPASK